MQDTMEMTTRRCGDFDIPASELRSLDHSRNLSVKVFTAALRALQFRYDNHPLAKYIGPTLCPSIWILDPGCIHLSSQLLIHYFFDEYGTIRADRFCQGTPPDFRPEPFRPELSLSSTTLK
ncbi:hypothetical protein M422DRAFT_258946 [Sphaerobolus stellatus SS14]|uniref:Uncharacterized protein n=1 Tax=Sphaerobolus stellatus (strain SS14) TaxID=990650 RepID=A0A0C9U5P6_SPHS4|nr:hypothetical protein M422DRAFT_258946 [Sphaerobolus stellatus SS14]